MPNESVQSEAEVEKVLKALASQLAPGDYARLEYERARAREADFAKKQADQRAVGVQWRMMIIDKVIIAAFVAYGTWYLNEKLEDFKAAAANAADYRKMEVEATRDAAKAAVAMEVDAHAICALLQSAPASPDGDASSVVKSKVEAAEEQLRKTGIELHTLKALVDPSLVEPLNGIANAGPEYALACKSGDKTRMQQINGQVCRFQTQLRVGLRDVFTGKPTEKSALDQAFTADCKG
jgi:hypothetical protein